MILTPIEGGQAAVRTEIRSRAQDIHVLCNHLEELISGMIGPIDQATAYVQRVRELADEVIQESFR